LKTHITIYSYGGIPGPCLNTHIALTSYIVKNKRDCILRNVRDDALISRSRSRETAVAVESGADVWMQLDHDITFEPEEMFRMCELALEKNAAICGVYSCRNVPPRCALRPKSGNPIEEVGIDELVPVTYFASGFVAIPVSRIMDTVEICQTDAVPEEYRVKWIMDAKVEGFQSRFPSLWAPIVQSAGNGVYEYLSEDYSASARMTLAGVDQYAWLKPVLSHWGDYPFKMPSKSK